VNLYKVWEGASGSPTTTLSIDGGPSAVSTWDSSLGSEPDWSNAAYFDGFAGDSVTIAETAVTGYTASWACYEPVSELRNASVGAFVSAVPSYYGNSVQSGPGTSGTVILTRGDLDCFFTNTFVSGGGDGDTPPDETSGGNTSNTPEVQGESNVEPEAVKPPIEVKGVSQELPPAPVIKVKPAAQVAPAPSANAHTGQGQSPWAYLLFGAGALLLLGAWRVRRNGDA
jgi:MYXO-CTERM domain-containing protein